jgi:hypothetical protein
VRLSFTPLPKGRTSLLFHGFSNAFNSVSREHMFRETRLMLPGLSSWVECCYSTESLLLFGDNSLRSCCGVQLGDPLGPLCFALTLQPIVERIRREVPNLICTWMTGLCVAPPRTLRGLLRSLKRRALQEVCTSIVTSLSTIFHQGTTYA